MNGTRTETYCAVRGCRHKHTHVSEAHRCGRCRQFGHGVVECTSGLPLRWASPGRLPDALHCTVGGCQAPWTHTREAHYCDSCDLRGDECTCPPRPPPPASLPSVTASSPPGSPSGGGAPPPLVRSCPLCKATGEVGAQDVFTGADCVVCTEPGPCVVFAACRHAVVCRTCAERL